MPQVLETKEETGYDSPLRRGMRDSLTEELRAFRGEYKFARRKEGRSQCCPRSGRAWGGGGSGKTSVCLEDRPLHTGIRQGGEAGEVAQRQDVKGLEHLSEVTRQGL